jgi:hypothetical protein
MILNSGIDAIEPSAAASRKKAVTGLSNSATTECFTFIKV